MLKGRIPWLRVIVDGVVIVGSILLAFGIDAWWDRNQEHLAEQEALALLLQEFEANAERRALDLLAHEDARSAAFTLLGEVRTLHETGRAPADLTAELFRVTRLRTHAPATGALSSLIDGGQLELIRHDSLRVALAAWPHLVQDMSEDEVADWRLSVDRLRPLIERYVSAVDYHSVLDSLSSVHPQDLEGLLRSRELESLLGVRIGRKEAIIDYYGTLADESNRITTLIRSEMR